MNKLQVIENVNLNEVFVLSEIQAKTRYGIGKGKLFKIADEAGAVVRTGKTRKGYLRTVLDEYFLRQAE